ncbi:MAG: radical SAM protein [Thermodesulfobacteriota bacterium]|nr:radical SAM protein [Thermodesulfobacteriota bacterium]
MKCLLVNPFYPISETPSPPLGLAYLAAAMENAGATVKILDYVVYPYSRNALEDAVKEFSPDMVGVTCVTMTYENAATIVRDTRQIGDILTVMGGPHVSMCPEETMAALPELDIVAIGEGDDTIVRLATEVQGERRWSQVPGIVYRDGDDIIATPFTAYSVDVRALPMPSRHLLPLGRYKALNMPVSITTSRGCPFKCIFCVGRKMVGAKVRYRDPVKVVDELETLKQMNFGQVNIADDLFTSNRRHCMGVCDEMLKRNLSLKWSSFARVDLVTPEILKKMKEAGCTAVSFGVETANPDMLKTIKKGITIEQVLAAITACMDAGIYPHVSFILGLPGETMETLEETQAFGERLKAMGASYGFHLLAPFPGTEIRERAEALGIRILSNHWPDYHANKAIVETPGADSITLDRIAGQWNDDFDIFLGEIKEKMDAGTAAPEEAWQLISLENTVINYDLMMKTVLEDLGAWAISKVDATPQQLLADLAERVYAYTDYPADRVLETLTWTLTTGSLTCTIEDGNVRWQWNDHL